MAITRYVSEDDLAHFGLNREALRGIPEEQIVAALDGASRIAADYFGSQYSMPLEAVGLSTRMNVAWIAAWILMSSVGFAPESGNDAIIRARYEDAISWLNKVRGGMAPEGVRGAAGPPGSGYQSPSARPMVISSSPRGFSSRGDETGLPYVKGGGFTSD